MNLAVKDQKTQIRLFAFNYILPLKILVKLFFITKSYGVFKITSLEVSNAFFSSIEVFN
jgi:hypothetical protein